MGIDDGKKARRCDRSFEFEDDNPPDNYCICGKGFAEVTPGPLDEEASCNADTLCGSADNCIMGIDDDGDSGKEDIEKCTDSFGFEGSDTPKREFAKPTAENGCDADKACICICNGYEYKDDQVNCKDALICNSIDKEILPEKVVKRDDDGHPKYKWVGGFLIHRDISDSEDVNGFEKNNIQTRTFYVENYNGIISVCDERPCIPQDAKYRIDASQP